MTAEEKLTELYRQEKAGESYFTCDSLTAIHVAYDGGVYIAPEHIDLIANLVVERLKKAMQDA